MRVRARGVLSVVATFSVFFQAVFGGGEGRGGGVEASEAKHVRVRRGLGLSGNIRVNCLGTRSSWSALGGISRRNQPGELQDLQPGNSHGVGFASSQAEKSPEDPRRYGYAVRVSEGPGVNRGPLLDLAVPSVRRGPRG